MFGACLAGLFEDPAFSVGMGGWRFWGAMNLALMSEYAVQTGWTRICIFGRPLLLTGLLDPEPGINCHIIGFITIFVALVFVASWFTVGIFVIWGARIPGCVVAASQPAILARAKAGHECREGCHGFWLLLAEVSGEPFVMDIMLKCR